MSYAMIFLAIWLAATGMNMLDKVEIPKVVLGIGAIIVAIAILMEQTGTVLN